jgi:hypothetical protein
MDDRPMWRQMYDSVDKQVAPVLEQFVRTDQFADMMSNANRLNREFARRVMELNRQWLRWMNLPSRTELVEVKQQLAAIERRLAAMSKTLKEDDHGR